jgi:hypothetical protein
MNIQSINAIYNLRTSPKDQIMHKEKDSVVSIIYKGFCKFQCKKEGISQMRGGMMMGQKFKMTSSRIIGSYGPFSRSIKVGVLISTPNREMV